MGKASLVAKCLKHAWAAISHCAACFCLQIAVLQETLGLHTGLTLKLRAVEASWKPEDLKMRVLSWASVRDFHFGVASRRWGQVC